MTDTPNYDHARVSPGGGADILDRVRMALLRYCVLPSDVYADAVVLWIVATHCLPSFDYAPRLVLRSAEKRSGKSRALEIIAAMCHMPLRTVNASVAYIFRSLGDEHPPTLLIDEADALFGTKMKAEQNEDLRGLLNAGHQRGLTYGRTVGPTHVPTEFSTFSMAALGGIGRMPDTIEDRAVVVLMQRRKPTEVVQPFRGRRDAPALHSLRDELALWAQANLVALATAEPDLPVEDRAADTWEPLVAVADAAGGDWPERARAAAKIITTAADAADSEVSTNVKLLGDIRAVFTDQRSTFLPSRDLVAALRALDESPWGDWDLNPSKLGHRLRDYGVRTERDVGGKRRGYRIETFHDAWDRLLPATQASEGVKGVKNASDHHKHLDTFGDLDTLKASRCLKASSHNPRSEADLTPLTPSDGVADGNRPDEADPTSQGALRALHDLGATPVESRTVIGTWLNSGEPVIAR